MVRAIAYSISEFAGTHSSLCVVTPGMVTIKRSHGVKKDNSHRRRKADCRKNASVRVLVYDSLASIFLPLPLSRSLSASRWSSLCVVMIKNNATQAGTLAADEKHFYRSLKPLLTLRESRSRNREPLRRLALVWLPRRQARSP